MSDGIIMGVGLFLMCIAPFIIIALFDDDGIDGEPREPY